MGAVWPREPEMTGLRKRANGAAHFGEISSERPPEWDLGAHYGEVFVTVASPLGSEV